ncbi:DUF3034 family protein [Caldimonas taiwanensis]|uniref:DUF3034 family protein n=1 Tax=Caldimonas taiwanensis TaxID=307483 RepID=UPI0007854E8A|nr:DUF3034 family protein [Caldimonas taiwanensis]
MKKLVCRCWAAAAVLAPALAWAQAPADSPTVAGRQGKLLLTGGVSSIDGAAGGGLTPWAVIAGPGTQGQWGVTAHLSRLKTQDYGLTTYGAALGWDDRWEVSLARQNFDAGVVVPGTTLKLDIAGLKLRVAGEAILDADTWMPQVAVGLEYKHLEPGAAVGGVLDAVGAKRHGVDAYVSATKLFLAQGVLVNGTLRATRANQNGLLGFGSAEHHHYRFRPEVSVAWLLRRDLAVGAEYRAKPNNLAFAGSAFREDAWRDVFMVWAPSKHASFTLAYVELGHVVGQNNQRGAYASLQLAY